MAENLSESVPERTFQHQNSLPPLPVPSLESSLSKYLDAGRIFALFCGIIIIKCAKGVKKTGICMLSCWTFPFLRFGTGRGKFDFFPPVRPFASETEFQATEVIVKNFQQGVGKQLHQKLLQRAETRRNWVCIWSLNLLFFHFTDILCPHRVCLCVVPPAWAMVVGRCVSRGPRPLSAERELRGAGTLFGTLLASCRGNGPGESQYLLMAHAAVLEFHPHVIHILKPFLLCVQSNFLHLFFHCFMCFKSLLCFRETLAPQKAGKTPLDMDQFRMLYSTCKVPGVTKDTIHNYFKTGATTGPLHTRMHC